MRSLGREYWRFFSLWYRVKNTQMISLKYGISTLLFSSTKISGSFNQLILHQACERLIIISVLQMGNRYPQPKGSAKSHRMPDPHPHEAASSLCIHLIALRPRGSQDESSVNCRILVWACNCCIYKKLRSCLMPLEHPTDPVINHYDITGQLPYGVK